MKYLIVLAVLACSVFAEAGLQDDWSGGPGVPGPVSDWDNEFSSSTMIDWSGQAGSLFLGQMSSYHLIRQLSDLVWAKPCQLSDDEYPDVFVRYGDSSSNWYKNESGGTSWAIRNVSDAENIVDISTGDIDGDGDIDIFASILSGSNKGFVWYERLNAVGNQWQLHQIDAVNSAGRVFSVDMDNDNDFDLVGMYDGSSGDDSDISWWENQNNGTTWLKHPISENVGARYMTTLDIADCNNDGDLDIVCGSLTDSVFFFEQTAADSWAVHPVEYISEGYLLYAYFSEVDGDGLADIVTCPFYYTSDVLWFRNTGNPSNWTVNVIPTNADQAFYAFPGDIDGDGDSDIAVFAAYGSIIDVFWLENTDPLGGVWLQHDAIQDIPSSRLYAADINCDGLTDLTTATFSSDNAGWWNLNSGYSTGTAQLESSVLYVHDVEWGNIDWSAETPAGTSVAFQVRASDDPSDMGDWSPVISSPGSIAPYLSSGDSHVQYRAILSTTDPEVTPVLDNVILTWTTTGIEGSEGSDELSLNVLENPVSGSVRFGINLPSPLDVTLALYDATGRLLSNVVSGEVSAGYTVVQVDRLQPGVYFCRMQADGNTFTEQFTVVSQ